MSTAKVQSASSLSVHRSAEVTPARDELPALIKTLLDTGQRLEVLTAGEVDTVSDATGRTVLLRHAQDYLRRIETLKQAAILDALPAHVALLNTEGTITLVNEGWRQFARENAMQSKGAGVGMSYLAVCDSARGNDMFGAKQAATGIRAVLSGELKRFVHEYACHAPSEQRWFMMIVTPLAADNPLHGVVVMHMDISLRQQALGRLDYLAFYDVLTGLANRRLFMERLAQYMGIASQDRAKLGLVLIDLEGFKNFNDSLGRAAGDELLKQVALWLSRVMGNAKFVARLDADHFAVVLPKFFQREGGMGRMIDKTVAAFQENVFLVDRVAYRISAKAGIALFPDDGPDADALFRNAEVALKKAKKRGDRYLFFGAKMTAMVAGRLKLENRLRGALSRREFVLLYQPKAHLCDGTLASVEVLLRWNDPLAGQVQPGDFISILEETGLIHAVGRWVLTQVIEKYLSWLAAGLAPVRIAVNVSALQLRDAGFVNEVKRLLSVHPEAANGLELEITESVIMEDVEASIASLQEIRALGVTIAIDDFGTGYSSLSYLSKLPIGTLKIDCAFVDAMTEGPQALALVATIINLAHSLGLTVVAEGVETQTQADLLRDLHCDDMQGYWYSRPLTVEAFEARFFSTQAKALLHVD
ncbi:MAG: bifunctional diguanylate cyclase/phosphodiesterase [Ideonella sp.]